MIGMRKSKSAMLRRRQCLLAIMAAVLILASIGTGYLGFVYNPGEDIPGGSTVPTGISPTSAGETTAATEPTASGDETEETHAPIEAPSEGVYSDGGAAGSAPAGEAPPAAEKPPATTETPPAATETSTAAEEPPANTEVPPANIEEPPAVTDDPIKTVSERQKGFDHGNAALPSNTATEDAPHTDLFGNPPAFAPTDSGEPVPPRKLSHGFRLVMQIACFVFAAGACVDILLLAMLRRDIRSHERAGRQRADTSMDVHPVPVTEETVEETVCPIPGISIGKIHNIGKRDYQQDSFGQTAVLHGTGILAVLADGMGGLSGGERVSQKIVMEALTFGSTLQANQVPAALPNMVAGINRAVNQMLGPKGLYTSGSTVVSALITDNALRWISVGDSRVYLYRDGQLSQLSRDHDLLQDWMPDILEGKRSMAEALRDPNGRKLTSFIGMGELRHIDYNHTPVALLPGDRVLLMSDGVYGTVSDAEMAAILWDCSNVRQAASHIGQRIMGAALPHQDNYTLIVLGYDPPDQRRNNG